MVEELLREASESCRIEGDELIVEHCYIERRLRPLNLFLRDADPAAAESAIIDYGNALRDLASSNVFAGDLLLKNFGVTSHGRVIFYDYDEVSLLTDCVFRDLPTASSEEEETSAEPWFYCGPRDVFPSNGCRFCPCHRRFARSFWRDTRSCSRRAGGGRAKPRWPPRPPAQSAPAPANALS